MNSEEYQELIKYTEDLYNRSVILTEKANELSDLGDDYGKRLISNPNDIKAQEGLRDVLHGEGKKTLDDLAQTNRELSKAKRELEDHLRLGNPEN